MNISEEIACLRAKIRNFLVSSLENGQITMDDAKNIAKFTAENVTPKLSSPEQITQTLMVMEKQFPNQYAQIKAVYLSCELDQARQVVDNEVLKLISTGDLDTALDVVNKYG